MPFRESRLTRLLQDSLGGNAKTRVIATLTPASDCVDESVSTLKFADRAKQVMVFVRRNEDRPVDHALVQRLQKEVAHLRTLLANFTATGATGSPPRLTNGGGGGGGGGSSAEEGYGLVPSEDGKGPLVWGRAEATAVSRKMEALEV